MHCVHPLVVCESGTCNACLHILFVLKQIIQYLYCACEFFRYNFSGPYSPGYAHTVPYYVYVRRLIGCMVKYISIKTKPHPLNIYVYIPHPSPLATHDHWPVILHISYLAVHVCMVNTLCIHTYVFWRLFNFLSWCSPWLKIELYYIHPYFM